jgi:hypothetical protein
LKIPGKYEYEVIFVQTPNSGGAINIHNVFSLSDHGFNAKSVTGFSLTERKNECFIDIDTVKNESSLSNSSFSLGSSCKNGWLNYKETVSGAGDRTPSLSVSISNISVASDGSLVIESKLS